MESILRRSRQQIGGLVDGEQIQGGRRFNFNVVGTSDVCMSSKQKVNDSNENLIAKSDDKPSQSDNIQDSIGLGTEKKSMKEQLQMNRKFLQLHRKLGHMSEDLIKRAFIDQKAAGLLKILCINTLYQVIILVLSNRTLYLERKAIKDTVSLISGFDKKSAFRTARS